MVGFMFASPSNIDIEKEANSAEANVVRLFSTIIYKWAQ
jgi:hypothetical protein